MPDTPTLVVMAGPAAGRVPAIHVCWRSQKDVDGRDKHGHDAERKVRREYQGFLFAVADTAMSPSASRASASSGTPA